MTRFLGLVADRFLGVAHDGRIMLGIISAAEDLSVHNEISGAGRLVKLKIALCCGEANSAAFIAATIGRSYLGAASIVSHAPVMYGAERLNVVARLVAAGLFWGHNVLGHNEIPL